MQIDSTPLDVLVRLDNGVTDRVDLTGIIDVVTRTVTAAVLRPTTKSVDASVLLARTVTPEPMRPGWPEAMKMSASALPFRRMLSIDERLEHAAARPVIIPQVIVVDHGKVFVSESFKASCAFLGISFQPARKATGTDKPHIERTLGSVATMFAQYVSGYTGRGVEYRGRGAEKNAVWSMPELQDLLDQWLIAEWQNRPHDGLRDPLHPGRAFTPNEKYAALTEIAGYVPLALSPDDHVELLPAAWRVVNAYGVKISRRVYDGAELNPLRMQRSGVTARKGLWEIHYDPYDISRIWVRDHWNGGWITVFWTQLHRVAAPFGELAWDHARKQLPGATESELANAVDDLLTRAGQGPGDGITPGTTLSKRDRRVAARTRAVQPAGQPGSRTQSTTVQQTGNPRRNGRAVRDRPDADLRPVPRGREMAVTPPAAGSAGSAVQLTTLPGWRQFVAAVPSIPSLFAEQDWLALEDGKRAAHDEERLDRRSPGMPAARADDFAPFAGYCRQRLDDDPHLRASALLTEVTLLGFRGTRPKFYRALDRHEIRPHPCPDCHVARISGYAPLTGTLGHHMPQRFAEVVVTYHAAVWADASRRARNADSPSGLICDRPMSWGCCADLPTDTA